jgi:hypothetical protein
MKPTKKPRTPEKESMPGNHKKREKLWRVEYKLPKEEWKEYRGKYISPEQSITQLNKYLRSYGTIPLKSSPFGFKEWRIINKATKEIISIHIVNNRMEAK